MTNPPALTDAQRDLIMRGTTTPSWFWFKNLSQERVTWRQLQRRGLAGHWELTPKGKAAQAMLTERARRGGDDDA